MGLAGKKGAKQPHRFHILCQILALRCLENFRNRRECRLVHDPAEGLEADLSGAKVIVPVDMRAERGLRLVDVEDGKPAQSDHAVEFREDLLGPARRGEIVTSGEGMGRVKADLQPLRRGTRVHDPRNVTEIRAETRPLARGDLERDADLQAGVPGMQKIQASGHARDPVILALAEV